MLDQTLRASGRPANDRADTDILVPTHELRDARHIAIVSLVSPILFMSSLAISAIVLMAGRANGFHLLWLWSMAQCLVCSALFLISQREKSVLFDQDLFTVNSSIWRKTVIGLGIAWGLVPSGLLLLQVGVSTALTGAALSGLIMIVTLLLRAMPIAATVMLVSICSGFFGYSMVTADTWSLIMSVSLLAYFSVLGVCTRWYFTRFDKKLAEAEKLYSETAELQTVLDEVGESSSTLMWQLDVRLRTTEMTNMRALARPDQTTLIGGLFVDQFVASPERETLIARLARRSEIVALEIQADTQDADRESWWRIAARPIYENDVFAGYRGSATDITALKAVEHRAAFLTEYDELTGLLNRTSFYRALDMHLTAPTAPQGVSGLLWIDLDNFKWINDTFGHAGGDDLLKFVSRRLRDTCRPTDSICRFGGDEFAVLTTGHADRAALCVFVEQLTHAMAVPYTLDLSEIQCSASIGFRQINPSERDTASLLKEADLALYSAKASGRATWKEYSEEFKARVRGQRELAKDLADAIGSDALKLQFQPIVDCKSEVIVAVEALLRWSHPSRGPIAPSEFVAIAENNGMMVELGDGVVARAIEAASRLPKNIHVGINISPLQIHSSALLLLIENKIAEFGVDPKRLELEITETVFMADNDFVLDRLHRLKQLGVCIALDDFGTGFSSLAYLQRFPFDKLKLDQAFVSGVETNEQSRAIARATIAMAHALGLTVTAEGVETRAQADFLKRHGCDRLQGFLYSHPKTLAQLDRQLSGLDRLGPPSAELAENVVRIAKSS